MSFSKFWENFPQINYTAMTMQTKDLVYVESDISEYLKNRFLLKCINANISTYGDTLKLKKVINFVERFLNLLTPEQLDTAIVTYLNKRTSYIELPSIIIYLSTRDLTHQVTLTGDKENVNYFKNKIISEFEVIRNTIDWIVSTDMSSVTVPVTVPKCVSNSSYPFIDGGVDEFIDDYLASTENILLLIGPPGTGKSTFIKYIISRSLLGGMVTFDPEVARKDSLYGTFIESDAGFLIFEDADSILAARSDGNTQMNRFLNTGDGIVSSMQKKIIFSTNLTSTDDIDSALLRPGRCYSVVTFRALDQPEAARFLAEHDIEDKTSGVPGSTYTLAELYAMGRQNHSRSHKKRTVGFL
jgi:hypothetical protein